MNKKINEIVWVWVWGLKFNPPTNDFTPSSRDKKMLGFAEEFAEIVLKSWRLIRKHPLF
jgi:hypothetical protein